MGTSLSVVLLAYYFEIWKTKPIDISQIMSFKPAFTLPKKDEKKEEDKQTTDNVVPQKGEEISTTKKSWADIAEEE